MIHNMKNPAPTKKTQKITAVTPYQKGQTKCP